MKQNIKDIVVGDIVDAYNEQYAVPRGFLSTADLLRNFGVKSNRTQRDRLNSLVEKGVYVSKKIGRERYYRLADKNND